jgi:hypothetical protein
MELVANGITGNGLKTDGFFLVLVELEDGSPDELMGGEVLNGTEF